MVKVVQATWGKFHQFDLARQLYSRGMLETIFSSFPRWALKREGLPKDKIVTFPWLHTLLVGKWKFGMRNRWFDRELGWWNTVAFQKYVAGHLPECDVFIALSGAGLRPGHVSQRRGAKYICDRGSPHIRSHYAILCEEFKRWGINFEGVDQRLIENEEAEYQLADTVTVPSEFARRSFIEMGVAAEKMRKIPYGVELSRFHKVGDPPKDSFEILFVGHVSFNKGIPYLLDGFSRLRHPRKRLRLVGAMQPEMKVFLQGRQWEGVEFVGPVPQSQLKEIMSRSHVMVLPSLVEGLAMVQGQALACGCPLISSDHTGAEDLFESGKEGFIVPIRDPVAITRCLEHLADSPAMRHEMGAAALNRVKRLGGWDTYGDKFAGLCYELTGKAESVTSAHVSQLGSLPVL